jgi:hypothetical protein
MASISSLLPLAHLIGLALGIGSATAKLILLIKCTADSAFVPVYLKVTKPLTRQIVLGLILLTLSGIGWLLDGYPFTPLLVVKISLVAVIWVLGPIIDNVVEPEFRKLAPMPGESASPAFNRTQQRYLLLESVATGLFYLIIVMWVLAWF